MRSLRRERFLCGVVEGVPGDVRGLHEAPAVKNEMRPSAVGGESP